MARSTPRVDETVLVGLAGAASNIAVGSLAWYAWLEDAAIFAFTSAQGSFTARKERRGEIGWYWKAYRKHKGTLHRAYLGKSSDLTFDRLTAIATDLAGRASGSPLLESARVVSPARAAADGEPRLPLGAPLPTGVLTFLFTDIEGSTQLWEQHPQAMSAALARHDAILRQAIETHRGVVFKTVGDGVHAAFTRAADALSATMTSQRALHAEAWGPTGPLRVRMALHSGAAEERDGDYFGSALNRVARILALSHGGQTLLSHATHDLVADDLPAQTTLRALGEYQLKDLTRPEPIFQLVSPGLPADFAPLHAAGTVPTPAAAQPLHLLTTKLYVPPARLQSVPRPRLLARLDTGLAGKLTLLSAPAGFGKTTLLSAWRATAAGSAVPFAWVSLDAADSDPLRFWRYVIAALDMLQPDIGATALTLLQSLQPPPIEVVLTPLLNALSTLPTDAVLVLDDYHLIDAPPIHTALAFLLDHLPPQLHLMLTTRADPPLPLTRLRARGQLTELRAADLRFTADETAAFLTELMGLPLSADDVAALEARTEGWIAGLQFAALAMRDRSDLAGFIRAFTGSHRFVVDYLAEEVLARQPPHLQMFLTQTAILDRMCGPLCDAVLGLTPDEGQTTSDQSSTAGRDRSPSSFVVRPSSDSYSQLILDQLERANLFLVPLDDDRHWYRYQHLFADVLRERLASGATSATVARLHQRASAWYEQAGLIGEAVRYALLVHDGERAAALIERYAMTMMLKEGNVLLVRAWLEHAPRALILVRPQLTLIAGLVMALTAQFSAAEQLLVDAAPALSAPDLPTNVLGQLAELRATIARFQGNAARSLAYAQQALALLAPDNIASRAGAFLNTGVALMWQGDITTAQAAFAEAAALGERAGILWIALAALEELMSLQGRQGQLRQVFQTATQAAQLSARLGGQKLPPTGMGSVGSAEVLYEWNDLAGAAQASSVSTDLLRASVERLLLVRGYVVLALVCQARGDHAGALDALWRCDAWFTQTQMEALVARAWLAAYQARLWVRQGELTAAARWAQTCAFAGDSELGYVQQLTLVQLHLAQSHNGSGGQLLDEANAILAQLIPTVEARGWSRYLIEGLALQALAYQAQGNRTNAMTTLERALSLAEPECYIRTFVDHSTPMAALLTHIARGESPVAAYAATLLSHFGFSIFDCGLEVASPIASPKAKTQNLVEPLSERELDVLRLIADGHSNQAIADTLVVAVSTVKRHINNIYGKLGVQSRTQALVRARDLSLLW